MKNPFLLFATLILLLTSCGSLKPNLNKEYVAYQDLEYGTIYRRYDAFQDTYFYKHSGLNKALGNKSPIGLYMFKGDDDSGLRLTMRYVSSDWLFVKYITVINSTGKKVTWYFKQSELDRKARNGSVYETYDNLFPKNIYDILKEVLKGEGVQMRLYGDDGYREYKTPQDETRALIEMIDYYEKLLSED